MEVKPVNFKDLKRGGIVVCVLLILYFFWVYLFCAAGLLVIGVAVIYGIAAIGKYTRQVKEIKEIIKKVHSFARNLVAVFKKELTSSSDEEEHN